MDCKVPQSCSPVMECPGPSSPEILNPENFGPVSGKVFDGRDGLLGCLHDAFLTQYASPTNIDAPLMLTFMLG